MNATYSRAGFAIIASGILAFGFPAAAKAMPNFAQAYGLDCTACHSQVPALNAYGRSIQRAQYSSMDPAVVNKALPVWASEQLNFDSQNQAAYNPNATTANLEPQWQAGNFALHVDGLSNDFSFHIQQWVVSNNLLAGYSSPNGTTASDLDTAWVAYNFLKHDAHITLGKMQVPSPSHFGFWMDLNSFAVPEISVGQHAYQLDANRWGSMLTYTGKAWYAQAGYYYSDAGIGNAFNWAPPNGQTFQYRLGYSKPKSPLTLEFYGAQGSLPVQNVDQLGNPYNVSDSFGAQGLSLTYDQKARWQPGLLLLYQWTHDSAPGANPATFNQNYGATNSVGYTIEPYWRPFKYWEATISARRQMTDDGLGNVVQSGNIDASFRITRYLHAYAEAYLQQHQTPAWRYSIWWSTPLTGVRDKPY